MARGQLRIYLGAAPGVGKTYAMLAEAQRRRARGTDVVVGLLETHGRKLTATMAEGLEIVPRRTMTHRGATFTEMDLDAVLARHPEVALVDELAHTNVPGCRNPKRWQDVDELLDAGINVITTLNIQHLESLNDVARQITGVEQHEKLPDEIARRADQIELVDMTPEALRRRMVHGHVYPPNRIDAALTHYFRPGNLTALRELALLWLADRVEEGLQRYRAEHGIATPWETRERIVVAVAGEDDDEKVIRRAARIAARTPGSDLLAVHVVSDDGLAVGHDEGLETQRALVTSLGGSFRLLPGADVADALLSFARAENATQMVLGASRRSRLITLIAGKSIPTRLARRAEHIDVHLVSRKETADRGHWSAQVFAALRSRKAQAVRDSAEAAALTRLAGCVLRGHGDPPALLEEMRIGDRQRRRPPVGAAVSVGAQSAAPATFVAGHEPVSRHDQGLHGAGVDGGQAGRQADGYRGATRRGEDLLRRRPLGMLLWPWLPGGQQRPDMRPDAQHRLLPQQAGSQAGNRAGNRESLEQPRVGAGEDGHHAPGPVTAAHRQLLPNRVPVLFPHLPTCAVGRLRRGDELVCPRGQDGQWRGWWRDGQVQRQHRRLHGMHGTELLDLRAGDHDASLTGPPGWVVGDLGPGRREEHGLVPIAPADHVRRRAVCPVDLDYLAVTLFVALVPALDRQLVSYFCSHD